MSEMEDTGKTVEVVDDRVDAPGEVVLNSGEEYDKKFHDPAWLYTQYYELEQSVEKMADKAGVSHTTIVHWMDKYGFDRRDLSEAHSIARTKEGPWTSKKWLKNQYVELGKPTTLIASEQGVSTYIICKWLEEHSIQKRGGGTRSPHHIEGKKQADEEWMRKQYWEYGKSAREIGEICGIGKRTVLHWLDKHGIERRDPTEGMALAYEKKNSTELPKHAKKQDAAERAEVKSGKNSYSGPVLDFSWSDADRTETKPWYKDKEWLHEQYIQKRRGAPEIAEDLGVSATTIYIWLDKHGIDRRDSGGPDQSANTQYQDKEWLEQQLNSGKTKTEIGDLCGVSSSTIHEWISRHDLENPANHRKFSNGDIREMRETYREKNTTYEELAEEYGCTACHVGNIVRGEALPEAPGPIKGEDYD